MSTTVFRWMSTRLPRVEKSVAPPTEKLRQPSGSVHLVGAGCGDPELLTLKAARTIASAEVLVYDRLVSPEIGALAGRNCQKIYVGKRCGEHTLSQEAIIELLIQHANTGAKVVRLKGGDPYVFGRGSEELTALRAQGIATGVCPGITAALGCSASAGIPLPHRGLSNGCLFLTGRLRDGSIPIESLDVDLHSLTLVIYMGVRGLPRIVKALKEKGLAEDWPVALIENGSTDAERTLVSDLENICQDADTHDIGAPALLMVGRTVAHNHSTKGMVQAQHAQLSDRA